jgi:hypothetical protein
MNKLKIDNQRLLAAISVSCAQCAGLEPPPVANEYTTVHFRLL